MLHRYTATLAISLVVFLAGMVMSFWILPGLDACPVGDDDTPQMSLELFGNSEAMAQSAGAEGAARRLLSSAVEGMLSPSPEGTGTSENLPGFASDGGGYEVEGEDGNCFEGSNAVGSVRTILQVRVEMCFFLLSVAQRTGFLRPCAASVHWVNVLVLF